MLVSIPSGSFSLILRLSEVRVYNVSWSSVFLVPTDTSWAQAVSQSVPSIGQLFLIPDSGDGGMS